jgi:MFS family permease
MVTLVFATYALAVMPSLLVFGPASDAIGRRPVLLVAIGGSAVAAGLFAAAAGVAWLFAAQVVEGVAMGALQGSAVAALVETHPRGDRGKAARVGSIATVGGAALGPLLAGLLAQYGPGPRRLPYLITAALLALAMVAVGRSFPHDVRPEPRWRARRPTIPAEIRRPFLVAAASAFLGWAVAALFLSLVPGYVTALLGTRNLVLIGGLAALMLGASAIVQLAGGRLSPSTLQRFGSCLLVGACASLIGAGHLRTLLPLLVSALLAGFGLGLAFRGSLASVSLIAPEDRKGDVLATFYLAVYLGTALPVIGVGVTALSTGLLQAVQLFGYAIGGCSVLLTALLFCLVLPER